MSTAWLIVVLVGAATVALKGLAPVMLGERALPAPVARVSAALAPALLAALVVSQTVGDAAAVALLLRAPLIVVLVASAAVAAAVNALT